MNLKFCRLVFLSVIYLLFPILSFCAVYYVDANNGSNDNSGRSKDDAWKTITFAISQVVGVKSNPAYIHVSEGVYSLESGEEFPLIMKNYMHLLGSGTQTIIKESKTEYVIYINEVIDSSLSKINFEEIFFIAINCIKSTINIIDCNFSHNYWDIRSDNNSNLKLKRCKFDFCEDTCVSSENSLFYLLKTQHLIIVIPQ